MSADAGTGPRPPALRIPSGYAASWALFTDWCAAIDHPELPADPDTVLGFLAGCPAAADTQRRRVAAIDHHHAAAGYARPGETTAVRAALGRPTRDPGEVPAGTAAAVDAALRALPSHGWTRGMFGRRDRCLLVLSQLAGVPYQQLAALTVGDVIVVDGQARISSDAGTWTVLPADDGPLVCGPCAVTRWVRALDVVLTRHSNRALTEVLKTADPVTDTAPHLCRSTRGIDDATRAAPLLPPIDQWGYVPFPLRRLTPHSLSRRVRDLLAGDLGDHREYPVDPNEKTDAEQPAPVPVEERGVYGAADQRRAWARRRADLADLAGITDALTDVEQRADVLNRRAAALLDNRS